MTDDRYTWTCRECDAENDARKFKCICGATRPKEGHRPGVDLDRRFCSFVSVSGQQCPLPGDMSERIGSDKMYCSGHLKDKAGPIAEQIYEDNVKNYSQIMATLKSKDLMTWWNSEEAQAQRAAQKAKAPPADDEAEKERRRKEAEQLAEEARIEREALQVESGAFPDDPF